MAHLMSGDPKNQNIPGLDSILRGEILRKDNLIAQLMNQNKMLISTKERQDIEMAAQQDTLEVSIVVKATKVVVIKVFSPSRNSEPTFESWITL